MTKMKKKVTNKAAATPATAKKHTNNSANNKTKPKIWKKNVSKFQSTTTTTTTTTTSSSHGPYSEVANFINQLLVLSDEQQEQNSSKATTTKNAVKSVLYNPNDGTLRCKTTKTFAMVTKIWEHRMLLSNVEAYLVENLSSKTSPQIHNRGLLYVMMYELLLGTKQSIVGGGTLKRYIVQNEIALRNFVHEVQGDSTNNDDSQITTATTILPRYVRINTYGRSSYDEIQQIVQRIQEKIGVSKPIVDVEESTTTTTTSTTRLAADPLIPDLVVVPRQLTSLLLVQKRGQQHDVDKSDYILQDKSSCFSAYCLLHGFPEEYNNDDDDIDNDNNNYDNPTGRSDDDRDNVVYIDACAAPGNKTSHLAALLWKRYHITGSKSSSSRSSLQPPTSIRIVAFDRDKERCQSLQRRMKELLVVQPPPPPSDDDNDRIPSITVQVRNEDFLTTSSESFRNSTKATIRIGGILVDPSCSGSGMLSNQHRDERRLLDTVPKTFTPSTNDDTEELEDSDDYNEKESGTKDDDDKGIQESISTTKSSSKALQNRLEKLSKFQIKILQHAMSLPNNNRIVYSTCSIYELENEHVIATVLANHRKEWEIIAPIGLQAWTRRGNPDYDPTKYTEDTSISLTKQEISNMIRVDPYKGDETNGFFVCCLQRTKKQQDPQQEEENEEILQVVNADTEQSDINKWESNVNEHLGLPRYQTGMFTNFGTSNTTTLRQPTIPTPDGSTKDPKKQKRNDDPNSKNNNSSKRSKGDTTILSVASVTTKANTAGSNGGEVPPDTQTATTSRKHAKKLQWKTKQYKQKRKRVVAKQQQQQKENETPSAK